MNGKISNVKISSDKKKIVLISIVILITLGAIAYWIYSRSIISTSDAHVDSHIYYMSPKVGGLIKKVYVDNFYHVKKGQILVKIDPIDYKNQLKSLEHQYNATENTILSLGQKSIAIQTSSSAQISTLQNNINAQKALLESYNVNLHKAYLDLKRYQNLYKHAVISKNRLEIENQLYHAALSKVQAQQKQISATSTQISGVLSYKNQVAEIYAQIAAYNNQLKGLQNQINIAKNNLKHTDIISPINGIITQKNVEPGQDVQPGQMLLMVVPLKPAWINANFKETDMYEIKPGEKATVNVDAYPGIKFKGYVEDIDAGTGDRFSLLPPENAAGNYIKIVQRVPVRIKLYPYDYKKYPLRVGLNCEVTIHLNNK
jgi:membrane fusion protein (multidrug efflux system)